ncbi:SGNH/GDSL hydrolase family protein [Actinoplanes sp. NBRC 103695]|uniref:SGNH/GDSL hydrolase family protein n=1 Tax=Actinoplanes sp. NBRC 103695 TaxID=3032202 RepID=UPI0024A4C6AC|nr:SGNH/GDSL hydrolase family protein [Actinoplanes sp. NBRC 103695]GLY97273.1 lipase 1 [Actinoplanes sp. NBRC 103695]
MSLVGTIALLVASGAPAQAAEGLDYVALGDSYAAGVGALNYDPASGDCKRSPNGYPTLWADAHSVTSFANVGCNGATLADVRSTQLAALNQDTDVVTISIGGNDVASTETAVACLLGSDANCTAAVDRSVSYIDQTLGTDLDSTFAAIRQAAPNASVTVVGYPLFTDEAATSCGLSLTKRRALNRGTAALDGKLSERAEAAGFGFADARSAFDGHGVCSAVSWINPFSLSQLRETFHPTAVGYRQGYLPLLDAILPAEEKHR